MQAIWIERFGGPEVLTYRDTALPKPGEGEALVRVLAAGVNFIDIYYRTGFYPSDLPFIAGQEAAGVVEALGPNVTGFGIGDRVSWATHRGSYAEYAAVPASKIVPLPIGIDEVTAAAVLLQGMAADYLTSETYAVRPGDTLLIHAAAGGLGQMLTQMACRRGARVIGTASTKHKADVARQMGADHVILYEEADFEAEVRRLTDGLGVAAVYVSVGRTTFEKSLRCLGPRGYLVVCGLSSGPVPPFDLDDLQRHGSLYLTRTSMAHYVGDRPSLLAYAGRVLEAMSAGDIRVNIQGSYPLAEAPRAHRALESRATVGKLVLIP